MFHLTCLNGSAPQPDVSERRLNPPNRVEPYSPKCFWQVSYHICATAEELWGVFGQIARHCGSSQHRGLECQECALLSGVAGRVEESLTDPGQLSAAPLQVWHIKPRGIIYLERRHSVWLYFSTHSGLAEGTWGVGGVGGCRCTVASSRRERNWSWCETASSHFVGLLLHKRQGGASCEEPWRLVELLGEFCWLSPCRQFYCFVLSRKTNT